MYPGSIFELIDQSQITTIPESTPVNNAPVFMQAFGSDKGPEGYRLVEGDEFFDLYGADLSKAYKKYGQPLIQAAAIVNAGGRLYAKRVVPSDAKLANVVIGAKVTVATSGTNRSVSIQLVKNTVENAAGIDDVKDFVDGNNFVFGANYSKEDIVIDVDTAIDGCVITTEATEADEAGGELNVSVMGPITIGEYASDTVIQTGAATYTAFDEETGESTLTIPNVVARTYLPGRGIENLYTGTLKATLAVDNESLVISDVKLAVGTTEYPSTKTVWSASEVIAISSQAIINAALEGETVADGTYVFPLFIIADNGRGVSGKSFAITHDVTSSKSIDKAVYSIKAYDNNDDYNGIQFVVDPTATNGDNNISFASMVNANSSQITAYQYEDAILDFIAIVDKARNARSIADTNSAAGALDYLFGKDKIGRSAVVAGGVTVTGTNPLFENGLRVTLENGTAGTISQLGNSTEGWNCASAFLGEVDYTVFDLDNVQIDVVGDANYNTATKNAILRLANFREDFVFLRDLGIVGLNSLDAVKAATASIANSKFQMVYGQYFDMKDPYSKRQVTVTIVYDIVRKLVSHMVTGRHCPIAGLLYDFICDSAIEGTVNFIPVIRPGAANNGHNYYSTDAINEKSEMEDARINYASYINGDLVVETEYNNQEAFSQFSYGNNIFGIQEVIKNIRTRCPKSRYSWLDGQDLENYKNDVNSVLAQYADNYRSLEFEYIEDTTYVSNKIFYGAIKARFRNFVQTEYFKVIALPS